MKCKRGGCSGRLKITHTYDDGDRKNQRAKCEHCGQVHALTTIAEPVGERGEGARARAERARTKK